MDYMELRTMQIAKADTASELRAEYSDLIETSLDFRGHQEAEEFGGEYDLRLETSTACLTPDVTEVLAEHGLGVDLIEDGPNGVVWQVLEQEEDEEQDDIEADTDAAELFRGEY